MFSVRVKFRAFKVQGIRGIRRPQGLEFRRI